MDAVSLSSSLAAASTGQGVQIGVLKAVQNLDLNTTAELFASIGLGANVSALA